MQECQVSRVNNYVIRNYILYWGKKFEKISNTAQKMKFSMKDFFRKCGKIRSFLLIWSHLLKKPFIENFIFCAVLHFCLILLFSSPFFSNAFRLPSHFHWFFFSEEQYECLLPGSSYEKVRTANSAFSLVQKSLMTCQEGW